MLFGYLLNVGYSNVHGEDRNSIHSVQIITMYEHVSVNHHFRINVLAVEFFDTLPCRVHRLTNNMQEDFIFHSVD